MKKIKPIKLAVFALSLMFILSLASTCFAYKVGPVRIYLTVARGKTETTVLFLRGNTFGEKVLLYLTHIVTDRRGEYHFEKVEDWKYSGLNWLKLYKATKVTKVGEKLKIIGRLYKEKGILTLKMDRDTYIGIVVKPPFNTKPGQYYAGIMVEPAEPRLIRGSVGEDIETLVRRITRIAVPIILTIPGRVPKKGGKVSLVRVEAGKEEIKILSTFNNTGNVLEEVRGKVTVRDAVKRRVFDVVRLKALGGGHPDGSGKVFPETLRDFTGEVQRRLPPGEYVAEVAFDYGYKYRLAKARTTFTVTPEIAQKQRELLILAAEPELLELKIPAGGFRTLGIKVSNLDYQPIHVKMHFNPIANPSWIRLSESEFDLPPGRSKTLRVILSIPKGEKPERSIKIELKADRGKKVVVGVVVLNPRIEREKIAKKGNGNL